MKISFKKQNNFTNTPTFKKQKKLICGFTLIELLIVVAIIGVLSSVVLGSLGNARAKGRDAKRLQDMDQLIKAIEMYYLDNGFYPLCTGANTTVCTSTGDTSYGNLATLQVVPTYIKSISLDPINTNRQYGYYYARAHKPTGGNPVFTSAGCSDQNYIVGTRLEKSSNTTSYSGWQNSNLNWIKGK